MINVKPTTSLRSQMFQTERWRNVKINALLVLVTMIWGSTFLIVQQTIKLTGPFTFLAMRFSIGTLVLAVIFHKRLARITHAEIFTGSLIGVFLFSTYALQTTGLQYITSSKAGFITGMYVPLVAILAVPLLRQKPTLSSLLGVIFSVAGVTLISVNRSFQFTFGLGELLVMGCALTSALHVILYQQVCSQGGCHQPRDCPDCVHRHAELDRHAHCQGAIRGASPARLGLGSLYGGSSNRVRAGRDE